MTSTMDTTPAAEPDDSCFTSINNFVIEKKIGRGQFSVVYKARCTVDISIVELKKVQVNTEYIFLIFIKYILNSSKA
jgi:NIMA (never in mitosis gene a)-related kinase